MNLLKRSILLTALATADRHTRDPCRQGESKKADDAPPAFATVDTDGNGDVSQTEFVAAMERELARKAAKTSFRARQRP